MDLFGPSLKLYQENKDPLTLNGVHLNELGNRKVGEVIAKTLLGNEVASSESWRA